MKYLLISLGILLFFFACKSTKEIVEEAKAEEDRVFITLKKGPCFGNCPVYTLSVYNSGLAEFHGKSHTPNLGKFKKQISQEELDDLVLSCEDADILSMQERYPSQIADLPLITIKYVTDDTTKTVRGKEDRPMKLMALEKKLSEIVESDGWILVEAADLDNAGISPPEDQREELEKTEVIIQPADGVKLPIWLQKNKERYGIRLLDRISAEKNYWLITWNQAKGDPDEFMNALQRDPEIKMAQFNLKIENR